MFKSTVEIYKFSEKKPEIGSHIILIGERLHWCTDEIYRETLNSEGDLYWCYFPKVVLEIKPEINERIHFGG